MCWCLRPSKPNEPKEFIQVNIEHGGWDGTQDWRVTWTLLNKHTCRRSPFKVISIYILVMDHCLSNTHTPGSSTPLWSTYIKPIIIHHLPPTHTLLPSALASTHRCIQAEAIRDHTQQEHWTIYGHRTIHVTHTVCWLSMVGNTCWYLLLDCYIRLECDRKLVKLSANKV